ncbi:MAG TPA: ComEA family DNA-binding protein [Pseudolysinimonas sp.]|nr:ComEA family DNA-binding protein [Pseudolysinimonas sp.]
MSARPDPDPRRARVRVGVGAALVLVLAGLAIAVFLTAVTPRGSSSVVAPGPGTSTGMPSDPASATGSRIFVHILGQVTRPGLYQLKSGDRGVDAVAAAGGFTDAADPASLNLARLLVDGEQIIVPALGEAPASGAGAVSADGIVDLNSADLTALETLPRIGPALAQRILDWREANGRFTAVEDLLNVTGIGDATFDGLKDLVRV